jgi:Zn-dependent protease with chaperone function/uncharacterized protein YegJ (DUF2314 family)
MRNKSLLLFSMLGTPALMLALIWCVALWAQSASAAWGANPSFDANAILRLCQRAEWLVVALGVLAWVLIALGAALCRADHRRLLVVFPLLLGITQLIAVFILLAHSAAVVGLVWVILATASHVLGAQPGLGASLQQLALPMVIGLALFALAVAAALVLAMRNSTKPQAVTVLGQRLPNPAGKVLWTMVRNIAQTLGAAPPENIVVGFDPAFFVTESDVHCLDGKLAGRTLFISLPLCRVMSVDEFRAVIAHELTHFRGYDTAYIRRFTSLAHSASTALAAPGLANNGLSRCLFSNSALGVLGVCLQAFAEIQQNLYRKQEQVADQSAIQTTTATTASIALVRAHFVERWWEQAWQALQHARSNSRTVQNFGALFDGIARSHTVVALDQRAFEALGQSANSHPSLLERLHVNGVAAATELIFDAAQVVPPPHGTALKLLGEPERIEEDLTELWLDALGGATFKTKLKQSALARRLQREAPSQTTPNAAANAAANAGAVPRTINILPQRSKLLFWLSLHCGLTLLLASLFALLLHDAVQTTRLSYGLASAVMLVLLLLIGSWVPFYLRLLLGRKPIVQISPTGIVAESEVLCSGLLLWDELRDVVIDRRQILGANVLFLVPKNGDVVRARLPWLTRTWQRVFANQYPYPHGILAQLLPMSLEELAELIAVYHEQHMAVDGPSAKSKQWFEAQPTPIQPTPTPANPSPGRCTHATHAPLTHRPAMHGQGARGAISDGVYAASLRARDTLADFIGMLKMPAPGQTYFSLSMRIGSEGEGEQVWLSDVNYDGVLFKGTLQGEPTVAKGYLLNERLEVHPADVLDWVVVEDGKVLGGFTLRERRRWMTPSEQAEFDAQMPGPFAEIVA